MNNLIINKCLFAIISTFLFAIGTIYAENNPKPFVIPELKTWTGGDGTTTISGRIVIKNAKAKVIAEAFSSDYQVMFGKQLTIVTGNAKSGDIVMSIKNEKDLGAEGYIMNICNTIELTANTTQGLFWATRTLLQISEQCPNGSIPKGRTVDLPEYKLRGFMIDCGRKYIPMNYLRNLTKIMAYYKMNTLQIHLNDNGFCKYFNNDWDKTQAGFRLECETYPGLTAKDGFYTKKEFIELQILAEQNGVEIIPEIDAPAHALAFTQYKTELGSKEYGMDHLDLFNPKSQKFMDNLWKEYIDGKEPVFRGKRVHIGTDEYSNAKKEVVEKFREFTDHYIKYVESFGKQAVVWGALTHANGDTPVKVKNVLMDIWYNGYANPVEMKKQGYKLVSIPDDLVYIVPATGYYNDYLNCQYLYEHWTPAVIGNEIFEENDPMIEGGMFAVWNDHVGNGITTKDIHHRVYPALQTIAAKCWTGKETRLSYMEFDKNRTILSEAPGVNELGRIGKPGTVVLEKETLSAEEKLNVEEIGYNYAVHFTIEANVEEKGTVLFRSANAIVYLSDPEEGKLGFEREGYRNLFKYNIPVGEKHQITIEGTNRTTRLFVDGELKEELGPQRLVVMRERDLAHNQVKGTFTYEPVVYNPSEQIYYQRTLVFPLRQTGQFNSIITNLKVEAK